jgi:hypothetical protein
MEKIESGNSKRGGKRRSQIGASWGKNTTEDSTHKIIRNQDAGRSTEDLGKTGGGDADIEGCASIAASDKSPKKDKTTTQQQRSDFMEDSTRWSHGGMAGEKSRDNVNNDNNDDNNDNYSNSILADAADEEGSNLELRDRVAAGIPGRIFEANKTVDKTQGKNNNKTGSNRTTISDNDHKTGIAGGDLDDLNLEDAEGAAPQDTGSEDVKAQPTCNKEQGREKQTEIRITRSQARRDSVRGELREVENGGNPDTEGERNRMEKAAVEKTKMQSGKPRQLAQPPLLSYFTRVEPTRKGQVEGTKGAQGKKVKKKRNQESTEEGDDERFQLVTGVAKTTREQRTEHLQMGNRYEALNSMDQREDVTESGSEGLNDEETAAECDTGLRVETDGDVAGNTATGAGQGGANLDEEGGQGAEEGEAADGQEWRENDESEEEAERERPIDRMRRWNEEGQGDAAEREGEAAEDQTKRNKEDSDIRREEPREDGLNEAEGTSRKPGGSGAGAARGEQGLSESALRDVTQQRDTFTRRVGLPRRMRQLEGEERFKGTKMRETTPIGKERKVQAPTAAMLLNQARQQELERETERMERVQRLEQERLREIFGFSAVLPRDIIYNKLNQKVQEEAMEEGKTLDTLDRSSTLPLLETNHVLISCVPIWLLEEDFVRDMTEWSAEIGSEIDWVQSFLPYTVKGKDVPMIIETTALLCLREPVRGGGSMDHQQETGGVLPAVGIFSSSEPPTKVLGKAHSKTASNRPIEYFYMVIDSKDRNYYETIKTSARRQFQTHTIPRATVGIVRFCSTTMCELEFKVNLVKKHYGKMRTKGQSAPPLLLQFIKVRLPLAWGLDGMSNLEMCIQMDIPADSTHTQLVEIQAYMQISSYRHEQVFYKRANYGGFPMYTARSLDCVISDPRTQAPQFPIVSSVCGLDEDVTRRDIGLALSNNRQLERVLAILLRNVLVRVGGGRRLTVEAIIIWKQQNAPVPQLMLFPQLMSRHKCGHWHRRYLIDGILSAHDPRGEMLTADNLTVQYSVLSQSTLSTLSGTPRSVATQGDRENADKPQFDQEGRMLEVLELEAARDAASRDFCITRGYCTIKIKREEDEAEKWTIQLMRQQKVMVEGYGGWSNPTWTQGREHPACYKLGMIWKELIEDGVPFSPAKGSMAARYVEACAQIRITPHNRSTTLGIYTLEHHLLRTSKGVCLWRKQGGQFTAVNVHDNTEALSNEREVKDRILCQHWVFQSGQDYWVLPQQQTQELRENCLRTLHETTERPRNHE